MMSHALFTLAWLTASAWTLLPSRLPEPDANATTSQVRKPTESANLLDECWPLLAGLRGLAGSDCESNPPAGVPPATVGVRLFAPADVTAGEAVSCRIRVSNRSPVAVYHVELRNRLDSPVEVLATSPPAERRDAEVVWRFARLAPGEVRELVLQLRAVQAGALRQCVRVRYEHGVCVETQVRPSTTAPAQPQLELRKEGPSLMSVGSSVATRLIVSNRGNAAAEDVVIVDELPPGLEHPDGGQRLSFFLGRLAPGMQRVLEYRVVARQTGQWTNRAVARARGGIQSFASQVITVVEPKLALRIEAPPQSAVGADLPVLIIVANAGDVMMRQIRVEYRLPNAAQFLQAEPQASLVAGTLRWNLSQLSPQEKVVLHLRLRPGQAGTIEHTATARGDGVRVNAQAQTVVQGAAGLLLVVVDSEDPILVGQDTRYHIIVRNQGSAPATNIRLHVEIPAELALTRVQGPSDHKRVGQTLLFEPLHLPPNTDRVYRVHVRALKPGLVRLRVEMTADPLSAGPVRAEESTTIVNGP